MKVGATHQFEYVDGQLRRSHATLFDQFAASNDEAVNKGQPTLDISYGPHSRQTLDLFRTSRQRRGVVAYFHAGYWQSRDKSGFRFLAPPLVTDGFDVALINYPLSPKFSVGGIVAAAYASIDCLAALTDGAPLILVGHSAGAQIAVEIAMNARVAKWNVAAIIGISGVFDLAPLIDTSINEKLALDTATARAASPLHRVVPGAPRAVFAVGALETSAFRSQTNSMDQAWAGAGNATARMTVADVDHFSILTELCRDCGILRSALSDLV